MAPLDEYVRGPIMDHMKAAGGLYGVDWTGVEHEGSRGSIGVERTGVEHKGSRGGVHTGLMGSMIALTQTSRTGS